MAGEARQQQLRCRALAVGASKLEGKGKWKPAASSAFDECSETWSRAGNKRGRKEDHWCRTIAKSGQHACCSHHSYPHRPSEIP